MFVSSKRYQTFKALSFSHYKFYQTSTARTSGVALAQPHLQLGSHTGRAKLASHFHPGCRRQEKITTPLISNVTLQLITLRKLTGKDKVLKI